MHRSSFSAEQETSCGNSASQRRKRVAYLKSSCLGFLMLLVFGLSACSKTKIVTAASGLYLRSCPQLACTPLTLVSNGTPVNILEEKDSEVLQGVTGRWTRVRVSELRLEGWVFGAYLSNPGDISIPALPPGQLKVKKLDVTFAPIRFDSIVEFCADDSYSLIKEDAFCEATGTRFEYHEPLYTCGAVLSSQTCNVAAFAGGIAVPGRGEKELIGYRRIVSAAERANLQGALRAANKSGDCFNVETADFLRIGDRVVARVQTHHGEPLGGDCNDVRNFATDSPEFQLVDIVRR